MHIAAALSTPTIAIFGPTSPRLWSPLNPLAAVIEPRRTVPDDETSSSAGPRISIRNACVAAVRKVARRAADAA